MNAALEKENAALRSKREDCGHLFASSDEVSLYLESVRECLKATRKQFAIELEQKTDTLTKEIHKLRRYNARLV
jgi:hypothetical protein